MPQLSEQLMHIPSRVPTASSHAHVLHYLYIIYFIQQQFSHSFIKLDKWEFAVIKSCQLTYLKIVYLAQTAFWPKQYVKTCSNCLFPSTFKNKGVHCYLLHKLVRVDWKMMCCWVLGQRNSGYQVSQYKPAELSLMLGTIHPCHNNSNSLLIFFGGFQICMIPTGNSFPLPVLKALTKIIRHYVSQ